MKVKQIIIALDSLPRLWASCITAPITINGSLLRNCYQKVEAYIRWGHTLIYLERGPLLYDHYVSSFHQLVVTKIRCPRWSASWHRFLRNLDGSCAATCGKSNQVRITIDSKRHLKNIKNTYVPSTDGHEAYTRRTKRNAAGPGQT